MSKTQGSDSLEPARAAQLDDLVQVAPSAIVSRTLVRSSGGTVTLFAFDAGQGLSEHTAPFDALVQVLDGELEVVIGGEPTVLGRGGVVLMPAGVPHALHCSRAARMLLVMLRDSKE